MRGLIVAVIAISLVAAVVAIGAATAAPPPGKTEDLDRLLAPIALYPDQLLAQMLLCASNPSKVGALSEWLDSHVSLKGTELQDAATKAGFDPSFVALVLFPQVVDGMAAQMDWTKRLGEAFAADRTAVFASIQRLRRQAQDAGTLKDTPQQDVETKKTTSGEPVIVIEPANPQVVYVPQYNPQVVYTTSSSSGDAVAAGLIGFTAGIAIGAAIDNDYYHGPYGWGRGAYMYDDAWDDWSDAREDAREDWSDHRQDIVEERGERAGTQQEQRTERRQTTQEQRTERQQTTQTQRTDRQQTRQEGRPESQAAATAESRGYGGASRATADRSGTSSDAFSGYSSGKSERAASQRGQSSRSSSRGSGAGSRRR